jgi:hypothetical protein
MKIMKRGKKFLLKIWSKETFEDFVTFSLASKLNYETTRSIFSLSLKAVQ